MRLTAITALVLALSVTAGASKFPNCANAEKEYTSSDSGVVLLIGRDVRSDNSVGSFGAVLKQVQDHLAAQGTRLVLLIPPLRGMAFTPEQSGLSAQTAANVKVIYQSYLNSVRAAGLQVVDLSDLSGFRGEMNSFFLKGDHHWSPEGARYAAQITAAALKLPPPADPVVFTVTKGPTTQVQGGFLDQLEKRCSFTTTRDQWETVQTYTTSDPGASLLGDEVNDVVIVGDSFVAGPWNFTGFLEQALQRRVLNASVSGGGIFTSMIRYLQNPPSAAPKVIVWEIFKGNLDGELGGGVQENMRLPANTKLLLGAFDTCKNPKVTSVAETKGGFTTPLNGKGKILKLMFSSSSTGDFTLTLNRSGKPSPMLVSRGYKIESDKTFTFELTPEDLSGLTGLTVTGDTLNGSVSVSQCQ